MGEIIKQLLITTLAIMLAQYIQTIIFCIFKANKYEDTLADKIAKKIKDQAND